MRPGVYSEADVKKAMPYAAELLQALSQAKARPVSPVYPQISQAIYKNVNDALAGRVEPGGRAEEGGLADQQRTVDLLTWMS